jgi:hypothetical protein
VCCEFFGQLTGLEFVEVGFIVVVCDGQAETLVRVQLEACSGLIAGSVFRVWLA